MLNLYPLLRKKVKHLPDGRYLTDSPVDAGGII